MPLIDPVTMSTPSATAGAAQSSKPADSEAATKPVPILPTSQAQIVRHAHPVLLGAFFYARFGALVEDPITTMWSSVPVVLAMQVAYTILCLPPAGAQAMKPAKKLRPGEKKKSAADGAGPNIAVVCLLILGMLHTYRHWLITATYRQPQSPYSLPSSPPYPSTSSLSSSARRS